MNEEEKNLSTVPDNFLPMAFLRLFVMHFFKKYSYGRIFSYKMQRYLNILNSVEFELKYDRTENSYEKRKFL